MTSVPEVWLKVRLEAARVPLRMTEPEEARALTVTAPKVEVPPPRSRKAPPEMVRLPPLVMLAPEARAMLPPETVVAPE